MAKSGNTSTAHIVITMEGKGAQNVMKALQQQAHGVRKELEAMEKAGQMDTDDYKDKIKELKALERAIGQNKTAYIDLDKVVKGLNKTTLRDLQRSLKECRKQMQNLTADDPKMKKLMAQYRAIDNQIGKITGQYKRQEGAIVSVAKRLASYVSIYGAFNFITGQVRDFTEKNVELSDSLADIRKVSGLSAKEVNELSDQIHALDTRTASEELHQLAYNAGRLGIQGVDGILQFVKAGNQINVALGEDLGQDALVQLMKMNEVMGTIKELGIEKSLLATGSAINTLSASSTASGEQIADFASRLSGIAAQANITTDELLGLGSASSALNMQTEVSATAFNKFINEIVAHTSVVAKAAGIEKEALDELLKSGKTMEAVVVVLEALNGKGGLRGLDPIMKDLGSDGARLNQVLAAFSKNTDVLRRHLNISTDAFREATSVTQEYNIKNENAAAILARIKNALIEFTVNSAFTAWLEDVLRKVYELPKAIEENSKIIIQALININALILATKINITSFSKIGILRLLVQLRTALSSVATTMVTKLAPAVKSVYGVLSAHPLLTVLSAVTMLSAGFVNLYRNTNVFAKSQRRLNDLDEEYQTSLGKELSHVKQLFDWLGRTKKGTEEYERAKAAIQKNYGKYLTGLSKEKQSLEDVAGAYDAITASAMKAAKARMTEKGIAAANENYQKDTGKAYKSVYDTLVESGKYSIEEVDSIMVRLRQTIDKNSGMPADIQAIIDSFKTFKTFSSNYGPAQEVEYNPLDIQIHNLRQSKKALDGEIAEIEVKYGKLEDILTPDPGKKIIELPEEPEEELTDSEKLAKAKKEHRALMNAIEAYYKQQQYVINEAYIKNQISATRHEQELSKIQEKYRGTRMAADEALLNRQGAIDAWNAELQRMQKQNLSKTEETTAVLKSLWEKNLKGIGDDLRQYGEGEMDAIWKSLEQDRNKIQEEQIEMRKEIEKILSQNDFERIVMERFSVAMQKLKILFPKLTGDIKKDTEAAMGDLQALYPKLFDIDINTDKGVEDFRTLLTDASHLGTQYVNMEVENIRLLYFKALEYGDAMVEAQKKTRDRNQKIADEIWKATGGEKREQSMEREGQLLDDKSGQLSRIGLSSEAITNDAEIELYKRRVEAAQEYRDLVMQMGGDVLSAEQKLNESIDELSNALVDKTLRHLETLKSFVDPLEDFGTKLGEAFAMDDAIERQEAFRDALKDMVGDIGQATKKMIIEWVKQKIQHSITQKAMIKAQKQSQKEMTGEVEKGQEAETALMEVGGQIKTEIAGKVGDLIVNKKKEQAAENVATGAAETSADATMGIAQGAAKTIGQLGWWGIPLVAVITALINGLLSAAMSKVGSLFGGSAAPSATAPTKLVTGMLTYYSGNVQSVLGSDGNVYSARVGGVNGSGIVSVPTLTNVNGQAALVGEQGPEIVIGRTTTRALMQNNPGLLAGLVQFDKMYSGRGFRTYAGGNVQQYGANGEPLSPEEQERQQVERIMSVVTATLLPTLEGIDRSIAASNRTNAALHERLKQPINATINKYGRGGLVDEVATGLEQEKKSGRNDTVRRLFGSR
jgi:TP901 family phage tail tape measure protein